MTTFIWAYSLNNTLFSEFSNVVLYPVTGKSTYFSKFFA